MATTGPQQCCCGCCCGSCTQAMSTSQPNPSICQNVCCGKGCGGAASLSTILNSIGKWGSVLTAQVQGRPVVAGKNGSVAIGAKGTTSLPGQGFGTSTLVLILVIVAVLIFIGTRR